MTQSRFAVEDYWVVVWQQTEYLSASLIFAAFNKCRFLYNYLSFSELEEVENTGFFSVDLTVVEVVSSSSTFSSDRERFSATCWLSAAAGPINSELAGATLASVGT